ncbi:MAG TPA: hypothetical protein PLZ51_07355, partial [Aggregatilineales bacterium]|nr:hypothetical protein [Aggregatilineales bacterium]
CTIVFTSTKTISANTTIQNTSGFNVTFDGNNAVQLFFVNSSELTLDNLTLTRGRTGFTGGAITNNGTLNINNSTFSDNHVVAGNAISRGGAIHNNGAPAILNITNSIFTNNSVGLAAPGGDTIGGAVSSSGFGNVTIIGSSFTNNHSDGYGGAIYSYGTMSLTNTTISNNTATGGISGVYSNSSNSTPISGNTFVNNTCSGTFVDNGGNTGSNAAGCLPAVALVASAVCNNQNLEVTITAGDGNFNITGSGPGLPRNNVGVGTHTLNG